MSAVLPVFNRSKPSPIAVFALLAFVLALRLIHLTSALHSPLSFQPGPDEDYYQRFGEAVASGHGQDGAEFLFMDPAYGYVLGAVFAVCGSNAFAVYLLQTLLDTATAFAILTAGRLLGRPRAGFFGALFYGLSTTAILFCTTLLKEIWVSAFMGWWVVAALLAIRSRRPLAWLGFGLYCGLGIGLRSNLLLMALAALLLPWMRLIPDGENARGKLSKSAVAAAGIVLALLPWSLRNHAATGEISPLPLNGGIVLHQLYNPGNPDSVNAVPDFVDYSHPSDIWRGYKAEAERREGHALSPVEVDRYWRNEALSFICQHPAQLLSHLWQKTEKLFSDAEIPSNRSAVEERMFSSVLRLLPATTALLTALGFAGLVGLALADRRWVVIAAPILVCWITVAVFFAEDRFRFQWATALALCSGLFVDRIFEGPAKPSSLALMTLAAAIFISSVGLGRRFPPPPIQWDRIVWGYIKMGDLAAAQQLAERISREQPGNAPILEALGYTASARRDYGEAARDYQGAIALRPLSHIAHYNLARVLLAEGDREAAAREAAIAEKLYPSPEYENLLRDIQQAGP